MAQGLLWGPGPGPGQVGEPRGWLGMAASSGPGKLSGSSQAGRKFMYPRG